MHVYVPFWADHFDVLEWASKLGSQKNTHCTQVVFKESISSTAAIAAQRALLQTMFRSVDVLVWAEDSVIENVTCAASRHAYLNNNGEPWFFWELNHIPLHEGWLEQIRDAYWTKSQGSLGVAARPLVPAHGVYSPLTWPIIKLLGKEAKFDARPDIFQSLSTPLYGWDDLSQKVDFTCATLWSNSSNTLDILLNHRNSTAVNVPNHLPMELYEPKLNPVPGTVDLMIVTYKKDYPWLSYCLKAIAKFATGFRQVLVVVPEEDAHAVPLISRWDLPLRVLSYKDTPGKGFLVHAEKICEADLLTDAEFVMHLDSDVIMKEPNDAGHYFSEEGKPVSVYRPYSTLLDAQGKVESDCYQWKAVAEVALGMSLHAYTMVRHGIVYPRGIYKPVRDRVEKFHGVSFHEYVIAQKNSFPMTLAEFPMIGGYCWETAWDAFTWVDCSVSAPRDLLKAFWSHGGVGQAVGAGWHDARATGPNSKVEQTAQQLIEGWLV